MAKDDFCFLACVRTKELTMTQIKNLFKEQMLLLGPVPHHSWGAFWKRRIHLSAMRHSAKLHFPLTDFRAISGKERKPSFITKNGSPFMENSHFVAI